MSASHHFSTLSPGLYLYAFTFSQWFSYLPPFMFASYVCCHGTSWPLCGATFLGGRSVGLTQLLCSSVAFPWMQQLKVVKWPQRARTDGPCQGSSWSRSSPQWACRPQVHDNEADLLGDRVKSYHTATQLMSTFHKNLEWRCLDFSL